MADFLLDKGMDANAELRSHGEGHTALHVAAYYGHDGIVAALLRSGARVDLVDKTWGTPPLIWALTAWGRGSATSADRYYSMVGKLVDGGARPTPDVLAWDKIRADAKMQSALSLAAPFDPSCVAPFTSPRPGATGAGV